jgi:hypothetical protein
MFPSPSTPVGRWQLHLSRFLPPFLRDDRNYFLCLAAGLDGNKVWRSLEHIREFHDQTLARCLITGIMQVVVQLSFDAPLGVGLSAHR